jgi:hypothetical protein
MVLLYTHTVSPRLEYILGFFSRELFDEPVIVTTDKTVFLNTNAFRINYSDKAFTEDELFIHAERLLFESGITKQPIDCFEVNYYKAFYQTTGDFPFDIFAAAFYLLSRYEEYLPHELDLHGRFSHTSSLAYREDFLSQPLVDIWLEDFRKALSRKFPFLLLRRRSFKCILTYDIDIAYAYKYKNWKGNAGGFIRTIMKGEWTMLSNRWKVVRGKLKDPYDCYEWLDALHLYCRLKPYYFFLVAGRQNQYDRNIATSIKEYQQLIEYYSRMYKVGIHPSWRSNENFSILKEEVQWLSVLTESDIELSRQHYIRMSFPVTYRRLIEAGIRKDFSMGYGTVNGFRASVSIPFPWYDLEAEMPTSLIIHPFCYMDANCFYEQHQTPEQAYAELMDYYLKIKALRGTMISIWHNNILGTMPGMDGWRKMFELFMKDHVYWDAYYDEV